MSIIDSGSQGDTQEVRVFPFNFDPTKSYTHLLFHLNSFNWIDPTLLEIIRTQVVPLPLNREQVNLEARYFSFRQLLEDIPREIAQSDKHHPWRLAQSKELFFFSARYPEEQITRKIIGGGIDSSDPRSLILGGDSFRKRFLQYHCLPPKADPTNFFLGVRKISRR